MKLVTYFANIFVVCVCIRAEVWDLGFDFTGYDNVAQLLVSDCLNIKQQVYNTFGPNSIEEPTTNPDQHVSCENDTVMGHVLGFRLFQTDNDPMTSDTTRQRLEMKVYEPSPEDEKARYNSSYRYAWWFQMGSDVKVGTDFFHIFQLKPVGQNIDTDPVAAFTLTNQNGFHLRIKKDDGITTLRYKMLNINQVAGRWIQAFVDVQYKSGNIPDDPESGFIRVILKDIDGNQLYPIGNEHIIYNNMYWNNVDFVRPKWGIYRRKNDIFNEYDIELFQNVQIWKKNN